jgi:hypothetical protein
MFLKWPHNKKKGRKGEKGEEKENLEYTLETPYLWNRTF